jgi:putative Ca2+/H+ antiporter (TMEM165/GDT1 family)
MMLEANKKECDVEGEIGLAKSPTVNSLPEVFFKALSLTFLAEWGDRSQMSTIALAAVEDMLSVVVGAVVGHALCTSLAVLGGRMLAEHVDERIIHLTGGSLFITFGVVGLAIEAKQWSLSGFEVSTFLNEMQREGNSVWGVIQSS